MALLIGVACGLCSCAPATRDGDVLLITVDTLRADHMSLYGYERSTSPQLEAIFADGAVFERAYATSAYTSASTASILSGKYPQDHRVRAIDQLFPEELALLTELVPDHYQTAAVISTRILSDEGTGIARRFDHFDDDISVRLEVKLRERAAGSTTDAALRWLREDRDPKRPVFLWIHYKDRHSPYRPADAYMGSFQGEVASKPISRELRNRIPRQVQMAGIRDPAAYVAFYDAEIAYADAEIGRLLDGYAELRPLDEALVILTSDHGETMADRYIWFSHLYQVYEELVRVPLLIRGPGVEAGRHRALVSGIDIVPTVLGFVGASIPTSLRGVDLRDPRGIDPRRTVFAESAHQADHQWRTAIRGDQKWVIRVGRDGAVSDRRRFDLGLDPRERRPEPWGDAVEPARRLLDLAESDPDVAGRPENPQRGELTEDLLRRLGYAE